MGWDERCRESYVQVELPWSAIAAERMGVAHVTAFASCETASPLNRAYNVATQVSTT